ncbi:MAG: histidine phosphatase family protein [Firmicutes bacterium]|nr:histidine phosphatase family protein [Bacillota bacterium]
MSVYLYLVRHGITSWNKLGKYQGHCDLPLSEEGRQQAEKCAARLQSSKIAAVYSSDLSRAMDTAYFIAKPHGLSVTSKTEFREIDVGDWEGRSFGEIKHNECFKAWSQDTINNPIPGGESYAQLRDRVIPKVVELIKFHKGSSLCIVSHSGPIKLIICHALGIDPPGRHRFELANAGISAITYTDETFMKVSFLNDTCHLFT